MIPNKSEKELALRGAEILNRLRVELNGRSLFYKEWVALLKEHKAPYYTYSVSGLINQGILIDQGSRTVRGIIYPSYVFRDTPVHYSILLKLYEEVRSKGRVNKQMRTNGMVNNKFISENNDLSQAIFNKENKLKYLTDYELVSELRNRGYVVTAEKTTVIKL